MTEEHPPGSTNIETKDLFGAPLIHNLAVLKPLPENPSQQLLIEHHDTQLPLDLFAALVHWAPRARWHAQVIKNVSSLAENSPQDSKKRHYLEKYAQRLTEQLLTEFVNVQQAIRYSEGYPSHQALEDTPKHEGFNNQTDSETVDAATATSDPQPPKPNKVILEAKRHHVLEQLYGPSHQDPYQYQYFNEATDFIPSQEHLSRPGGIIGYLIKGKSLRPPKDRSHPIPFADYPQLAQRFDLVWHDVTNAMSLAYGYAKLAIENSPSRSQFINMVDRGLETLESTLMDGNQELTGQYEPELLSPQKLEEIISNTCSAIFQKNNINLHITPAEQPPPDAFLSSTLLIRLITNIATNAVKAYQQLEKQSATTEVTDKSLDVAITSTTVDDLQYVKLEVTDHGPGLPEKILNNGYQKGISDFRDKVGIDGNGVGMAGIVKRFTRLGCVQIQLANLNGASGNTGARHTILIPTHETFQALTKNKKEDIAPTSPSPDPVAA